MSRQITRPEDFFGFTMGEDRKIARWDKIIKYFNKLTEESDCIQVTDLGPSTEGHPFLLVTISSAANLANLEHLRQVNLKITDPRGQTEEAIDELIKEGKAIILQSMSLHASEIGGTQMTPELAYDLLASDSEEIQRILDNVIFLMVPCFNPGGQHMVTDWYNKWVGTENEGCMLPWLYHKYAGHDNNRDAFMQNLVESQYMAKLLFREWRPHAYQDHHHMGSYGPRYFVAPYSDPIRPHADPLIWRELSWYGSHMAYKLEEAGKTGIANGIQFPGWGHFGFHWLTNHHNIAGMLTESASAKLASPLYIHATQLQGADARNMPEYAPQSNFPNPWPGGWWTLRDIVEQKKISALALLDQAARHRETVLRNAYLKAKRQTERGETGDVFAYVINPDQHDPLTVRKLVQVLLNQGIEVQVANAAFEVGCCSYPAGSFVVFLAQPKLGVIRHLLGPILYPDTPWTRTLDGKPVVFDAAADTVAEYMGVKVAQHTQRFRAELSIIEELPTLLAQVTSGQHGFVFDGRLNDSYAAVNKLQALDKPVWRLAEEVCVGETSLPAGAFLVEEVDTAVLEAISAEVGVSFFALSNPYSGCKQELRKPRVGLYQRYWGGNADEGWTRLIFEKFAFPYTTLKDDEIKAGNLKDNYDVIIFPSDSKQMIVDVNQPDRDNPFGAMLARRYANAFPPEYRSGIGQEGVKALREFVQAGGRLVAINGSCAFAIDVCQLQVRNVLAGVDAKEFYTHGSTLRALVDSGHPLGAGMPEQAWLMHWDSPAFQIVDPFTAEDYRVIVEYPQEAILQSGRLVGENRIKGKAAMIAAKQGQGEVVLIGFGVQRRGQMHGTFKLLFNCLY